MGLHCISYDTYCLFLCRFMHLLEKKLTTPTRAPRSLAAHAILPGQGNGPGFPVVAFFASVGTCCRGSHGSDCKWSLVLVLAFEAQRTALF